MKYLLPLAIAINLPLLANAELTDKKPTPVNSTVQKTSAGDVHYTLANFAEAEKAYRDEWIKSSNKNALHGLGRSLYQQQKFSVLIALKSDDEYINYLQAQSLTQQHLYQQAWKIIATDNNTFSKELRVFLEKKLYLVQLSEEDMKSLDVIKRFREVSDRKRHGDIVAILKTDNPWLPENRDLIDYNADLYATGEGHTLRHYDPQAVKTTEAKELIGNLESFQAYLKYKDAVQSADDESLVKSELLRHHRFFQLFKEKKFAAAQTYLPTRRDYLFSLYIARKQFAEAMKYVDNSAQQTLLLQALAATAQKEFTFDSKSIIDSNQLYLLQLHLISQQKYGEFSLEAWEKIANERNLLLHQYWQFNQNLKIEKPHKLIALITAARAGDWKLAQKLNTDISLADSESLPELRDRLLFIQAEIAISEFNYKAAQEKLLQISEQDNSWYKGRRLDLDYLTTGKVSYEKLIGSHSLFLDAICLRRSYITSHRIDDSAYIGIISQLQRSGDARLQKLLISILRQKIVNDDSKGDKASVRSAQQMLKQLENDK